MKKVITLFTLLILVLLTLSSCDFSLNHEPVEQDKQYKIYLLAKDSGYTGTYEEWLKSIKGEKGDQGLPGLDGNGIEKIEKTFSDGLIDIYTMYFTNGETFTFSVTHGESGIDGKPGVDGIDCYLGYDGYIWNGSVRTEYKQIDCSLPKDVVENTIGIEQIMAKYYPGSYIDLKENYVCLMNSYMPVTNNTLYSNSVINKIKVVVDTDGELSIGKALVKEIIDSRLLGTTPNTTTELYKVKKGVNEIELNLSIGYGETLVIGGNNSVNLYYAENIPLWDEDGNYTYLDSTSHDNIIEQNDYPNTLAIQVSASFYEDVQLVKDFNLVENVGMISADLGETYSNVTPLVYKNLTLFENKKINKIKLFVTDTEFNDGKSTNVKIDDNKLYSFHISIIDSSSVYENSNYKIKKVYEIKILGKDLIKNSWNEFDVSDFNIYVNYGETLGFGNESTTLETYFSRIVASDELTYYGSNASGVVTYRNHKNLLIGVEAEEPISKMKQLERIQELEQKAIDINKLSDKLKGLYVSVFGASMCTYDGYSNDITRNTTIKNNAQYYGDKDSTKASVKTLNVEDTFWMQIINQFNMNLCVNNSWSGSQVVDSNLKAAGYNKRPTQLHINTGELEGTTPDIILSFMGCNDFNKNRAAGTISENLFKEIEGYVDNDIEYTPNTFAEGYIMMVYKMTKAYPNADIFLFNMPNRTVEKTQLLIAYENIINIVAEHYGHYVLDLTNHPVMSGLRYELYTCDSRLHPDPKGFDIWTQLIIDKMLEVYK